MTQIPKSMFAGGIASQLPEPASHGAVVAYGVARVAALLLVLAIIRKARRDKMRQHLSEKSGDAAITPQN